MKIPIIVLKLAVNVPKVTTSILLWVVVLALMPPVLGLAGFVTGVVAYVLLATGVGERIAVRWLTGARPVTAAEEAVLAAVLTPLDLPDVHLGKRELLVRRSVKARTPAVQLVGQQTLAVTPGLIEATYRGQLRLDEARALVVHAAGRYQAEHRRCEVALLLLTLPWTAVEGVARGIRRGTSWVPFIEFAWALRGVIGIVAVAQQIAEGRPALGILAGAIVGLTYLVPAAANATARRIDDFADEIVVRHGSGRPMAKLLRRHGAPLDLDRVYRLEKGGCGSYNSYPSPSGSHW